MPKISEIWSEVRGYCATVFALCLLGWILTNMDQALFGFAIPAIMGEFNAGPDAISIVLAVSFAFTGVAAVIVGLLADHYGRRIMFLFCLAASALFVGLHALIGGLVSLTILRMLAMGLSNGLAPITNSFAAEAAPARYRGLVVGLLQTGYPIGWFIASLLFIGITANTDDWRYVFVPALFVVPIAFLLVRRLPESKKFERVVDSSGGAAKVSALPDFSRIGELFGPGLRKQTLFCFTAFLLWGGAYAGTAFYFPTFFAEVRNYSSEQATFVVGLSYGMAVVGYILAAYVGEFVTTRRNTCIIWAWSGAVAVTGLIWASPNYVTDVIWFSIMASFFYGMAAVIMTLVVEIFPTRVRATGAAFAGTFALNIGMAIFPLAVGQGVVTIGWEWTFTLVAVPSLLVAGVALLNLENVESGLDLDEITA